LATDEFITVYDPQSDSDVLSPYNCGNRIYDPFENSDNFMTYS